METTPSANNTLKLLYIDFRNVQLHVENKPRDGYIINVPWYPKLNQVYFKNIYWKIQNNQQQ